MKVESVSFKKFFKNKQTIYKNIIIASKRARQIVDDRFMKMEAMRNIEDTEQLIEIEDDDIEKPKCISVAMDELLSNNLNYSEPSVQEENEE